MRWCIPTVSLVAACSLPGDTEHISLVLREGSGCSAPAYEEVEVVSVELLGDDGHLCSLAKRCLFAVGGLGGTDDLAALLAEAKAPLIDEEATGATTIAIFGHARSCWQTDDLRVSGFGSLADVEGGQLELQLDCPGTFMEPEIPFCQ